MSKTEKRAFCWSTTQQAPSAGPTSAPPLLDSPGPPPWRPIERTWAPRASNTRTSLASGSST